MWLKTSSQPGNRSGRVTKKQQRCSSQRDLNVAAEQTVISHMAVSSIERQRAHLYSVVHVSKGCLNLRNIFTNLNFTHFFCFRRLYELLAHPKRQQKWLSVSFWSLQTYRFYVGLYGLNCDLFSPENIIAKLISGKVFLIFFVLVSLRTLPLRTVWCAGLEWLQVDVEWERIRRRVQHHCSCFIHLDSRRRPLQQVCLAKKLS